MEFEVRGLGSWERSKNEDIILRSRNSQMRDPRTKSLTKSVSIFQAFSLCCFLGYKEKVS